MCQALCTCIDSNNGAAREVLLVLVKCVGVHADHYEFLFTQFVHLQFGCALASKHKHLWMALGFHLS